jgi:S-adenosylmethionine:tRNA ribosyltransferase-isomerase
MRTAEFDYELPTELIAQEPAKERDSSRLLILNRQTGAMEHRFFQELPGLLSPGDVLVLNNSRVIPARLRGRNQATGGEFELLLLEENAPNDWWVMIRPGKRARIGTVISLSYGAADATGVQATVLEANEEGHRRLRFEGTSNILEVLDALGEVPTPPYIRRQGQELAALDRERYQTLFAGPRGSVAAPTAGLHFAKSTLAQIQNRGVKLCFVTLHVGLGTFAPVKAERVEEHRMHAERYEVGRETTDAISTARAQGRRVVAVGTTTVRVLESVAAEHAGQIASGSGSTRIFIHPPAQFKVVDSLLTNFHLPRSTLLMLVSAFAAPGETRGRDLILKAYGEAIERQYRFFSYGDAMLIL